MQKQSQSLFRRAVLICTAATAVCLAAGTRADPLVGTGWSAPPPGDENVGVTVTNPSIAYNGAAGGFTGFFNGNPILFWCYQLDQSFGFNVTYDDYTAQTISDPANAALSELFTEVGGPANVITSDLLSVAFQLAVWEIKYESGGPFDLFSGNFQVTSGASATTTQAQTWLNNLGSIQGYTITLLHSDSAQDFVMGVPKPPKQELPEPSALLLLGLGLATMFAVTRRRGSLAQGML